MKTLLAVLAYFGLACSAFAADFTCTIRHGVYKAPADPELKDVLVRDPSLGGKSFTVTRSSGRIAASGFLSNEGEEISVLRNIDQPVNSSNQFEVMSSGKNSGIKLLSIDVLDGQFLFKYYFSIMGMILTGECIDT